MHARLVAVSLAVLALAAVPARAGIDVEVGNGDKISATLSPATEVETFRVRVPAGAKISVKAKTAKKGPLLHVAIGDPAAAPAGSSDGKAPSIAVVADSSGVYTVTVASADGTTTGDYSLSISWKSATSFTKTVDLAPGATDVRPFAADAGAVATITAKPAKRSKATAALDQLTAPDAGTAALTGTSAKPTLPLAGDYVVRFRNAGATDGGVTCAVKLKLPRASKRRLALTSTVIGAGGAQGDTAFAALVGAAGGSVVVPHIAPGQPGAAISGSSVAVPAGALSAGTAIYIATTPAVKAPGDVVNAGPPVFFGPEGTRFDTGDKSIRATISIPYDPAYDATTDSIVIYTRDAKGKVTAVPKPYDFDAGTHTVSFPTSHFSAFQPSGPSLQPQFTLALLAGANDPRDVCSAHDPATQGQPIRYYVAGGSDDTVIALRLTVQPGPLVTPEVYAGGGADSSSGTPRLQFKFVDPVTSVFASDVGHLWIATTRQIFEVTATGNVQLVAGTGQTGDGGDNGSATGATFTSITSIIVTPNNQIYVADAGAHRIRFIDLQSSFQVTAWAGAAGGSGVLGTDAVNILSTTFLGPTDMDFDATGAGLYVTDGGRVRHLAPGGGAANNATIAGSSIGQTGSGGDGGTLLSATFTSLSGIVLYADPFHQNDAELIVSDSADHTLRKLDLTTNTVTLVGGQHGSPGFGGDIDVETGLLDGPTALFAEANDIIFVDTGNKRIRDQTLLH